VAHQWKGVIEEYRDRLPVSDTTPVVTLREGGTPLIAARTLSERTGCEVWLKFEGANPTGSFKDRGMTLAISKAAEAGAKAVICASTGNTSASAAAYATAAGMACAVLVPDGKIALGKLSQAIAHGAHLLQVDGNFDDCLTVARKLAEAYPVELVNSVNPFRIEGQKTASFEVVDFLGDAPDVHCLPVGNAGNITAYWRGYVEYARDGGGVEYARDGGGVVSSDRVVSSTGEAVPATKRPRMWGYQAAGAAPIVLGHPVSHPETIATAIRIGNPASWSQAVAARDESGGLIDLVGDDEILAAHRLLSGSEGVFVEPASAASVAGLLKSHAAGMLDAGQVVVCTVTGHGLKDPQWALRTPDGAEIEPTRVPSDAAAVARALGLQA
jgi:threonine synthase